MLALVAHRLCITCVGGGQCSGVGVVVNWFRVMPFANMPKLGPIRIHDAV